MYNVHETKAHDFRPLSIYDTFVSNKIAIFDEMDCDNSVYISAVPAQGFDTASA